MLERAGDYTFGYRLHDGAGEITAQWHFAGASTLPVAVQTWEVPPGGTEGMHRHEDDQPLEEMYLVLDGTARMRVDDDTYDLVPGDAVLAGVGQDHDLVNTGDGTLRVLVVWGPPGSVDFSAYRMSALARQARESAS